MAPFEIPTPLLSNFKEGVGAITVHGGRLYIGTTTGSLHIYELGADDQPATLIEVKQAVARRAIDQLGFIKDANSLAVLSSGDATVTLLPLPSLSPPTVLAKAKGAMSFGIHTSVQQVHEEKAASATEGAGPKSDLGHGLTSMITRLVIGCKRRAVVYTWVDGEPQEPKEVSLQHSPRAVAFFGPNTACLAYPANDYGLINILAMTAVDIVFPAPTTASVVGMSGRGMGMGAITGLFSAKAKPTAVSISDKEVLITREGRGVFIGPDGKPTRSDYVEWPSVPEDQDFIKPYLASVYPPNTVPASSTNESSASVGSSAIPAPVLQIISSLSLTVAQTSSYPFATSSPGPATSPRTSSPDNYALRLLSITSGSRPNVLTVSTPTEKSVLAAEGSTIWQIRMKPWNTQVDELVQIGAYRDALALLESIDDAFMPDKPQRQLLVRKLNAVSQFRSGAFDAAIDAFIELNVSPAKVVALFPTIVAGRLATPPEEWITLFGGPANTVVQPDTASVTTVEPVPMNEKEKEKEPKRSETVESSSSLGRMASPMGSIRETFKSGFDAVIPAALRQDDTASIKSKHKPQTKDQLSEQSIETLIRYLSDRRTQYNKALEMHHFTPAQLNSFPALSITSTTELYALPDLPFPSLTPTQLVKTAQIVDTSLFKCYLVSRPGLLGPFCRQPNWCEVLEVEEELGSRGKYQDLIYLYGNKKMHAKALNLLRSRSDEETDMDDKLQPSVTYLQKLGPEYLDLIFQTSKWVLGQDRDFGFQIFTSEEVELPRDKVVDFMETIDLSTAARYLEYLIAERGEVQPYFHDQLAELYLRILSQNKHDNAGAKATTHGKLLGFVESNQYYHVDRLFGLLPSDDLFDIKAVLLGKLGRHDQALELYVYRLKDYMTAEQYCKTIYQPNTPTESAFLWLLRIYLQPRQKVAEDLMTPALDLVSRHGPRLDPVETLNLIPPLVTAKDLRPFLMDALCAPIFDKHVIREVSKARQEQVAVQLMLQQSRRVKITDSRTCPQCHKRLGTSVIAVHAPRGEVTHYQCREQFSKRLRETTR